VHEGVSRKIPQEIEDRCVNLLTTPTTKAKSVPDELENAIIAYSYIKDKDSGSPAPDISTMLPLLVYLYDAGLLAKPTVKSPAKRTPAKAK